jgi:acyl-[acyl-carrier-protein] desaturase
MRPEHSVIDEIEKQRPRFASGLLRRAEKNRLLERGISSLYRWYLARSQAARNWNPDRHFDWRSFRTDHSPEMNYLLEGFFAVEQYVPDYVRKLLNLVRNSYGRAQFQVRWGAEEQKHMDAWLNTILFSKFRSPKWIDDYKEVLRDQEWNLPWDDPQHMLFYTLIQERATQINYLLTGAIAGGKSGRTEYTNDVDPVLEQVCHTISIDEAAHYHFFNEASRLMFYYFPSESIDALVDVIKHFAMPGVDIIPNFQRFQDLAAKAAIFGPREYTRDVLQVVLSNLEVNATKAFSYGLRRSRRVPDADGNMRDSALFEAIDYEALESATRRFYGRLEKYEREVGRWDIDPTEFVPSGLREKLES